MASGKKKRKGKIQSINFNDETYDILTREVTATDSNYSSRINTMVRCTYGLSSDIKEDLARYCYEQSNKLAEQAADQPEFVKKGLMDKSSQYTAIVDLLTSGRGVRPALSGDMQRIEMFGRYVLLPCSWIVLDRDEPAVCSNAFVIEFQHSTQYELPHFVLFTNQEELSEKEKQDALDAAAAKSEIYDKIRRNILNDREAEGQPKPGFFRIAKLGTAQEYPYGAVIVPYENS